MGLIYGTVVVAALLDAESVRAETYPATVGAVAVALGLVWLSHSYAEFAGQRLRRRAPLSLSGLGDALRGGSGVLIGAAAPLVALLICWAAKASLGTAVSAGIYTSVGMLVTVEVMAAIRARLTGIALLMQAAVGTMLGALLIALKLILH